VSRPSLFTLAALSAVVPLLASCGPSEPVARPTVEPQDARWASHISHHTSGWISRRDKIRIVFTNAVVAAEQVGQPADAAVRVEPRIAGSVTYATANEIVIVPAQDLPAERSYVVTLRGRGLLGIPADLERYQFVVQVLRQEFEVAVTGVDPDPAGDSSMVVRGTLVTADVEDHDRVERVLTARFEGGTPPLRWQHGEDGRTHAFDVPGVRRQAATRRLTLTWDGDPIGVDAAGSREVEIPGLDLFTVTRVEAVQDQRQYVVVQFSDSLDPRQNLSGLVSLDAPGVTLSTQGHTLRLFPPQQMAGRATVTVEAGVRSAGGKRLAARVERVVTFASDKPQVRFVGKGTILPGNDVLSIPFEAVNVHSVQVTAFRVFDDNISQFLQVNTLDGDQELARVGRHLWRKTMALPQLTVNQWNRYSLDVTDLVRRHPGALFRILLSINRGNSSYNCSETENQAPVVAEAPLRDSDDYDSRAYSSWDWVESYYGVESDEGLRWTDRNDPCKDAYFRWSEGARAGRNFLASNVGIVVKRDQQGGVLVATTDLRTAEAMGGVTVRFMNFQNQQLGTVITDGSGIGRLTLDGVPFYALAERDGDRGYLKLSPGLALSTSNFDVGGAVVTAGLKGVLYGERDVWRPGDDIHLTFVLEDERQAIPDDHPASIQLLNPMGQLVHTATNASPVNGFYTFPLATAEDAPTGNWTAIAEVGGTRFTRRLKVETVAPNRLRVELDFGGVAPLTGDAPVRASVFGQWLHGAVAGNLRADVQVRLTPTPTRFNRYADYGFDDPARSLAGEPQTVFDGTLDAAGRAAFDLRLTPGGDAPGMLAAQFVTRVFEQGGAFSTNRRTETFSPYARYVGLRLPRGDAARGMLLTDTTHTVDLVTLSAAGDPVSVSGLRATLYKVEWKWWWDRSGESLAEYAQAEHRAVVSRGEASTVNGRGTWQFRIDYPAWGRYLLRVCDPAGRHCAGKTFYLDWPGWAGRAQEEAGGAGVLTFFADKPSYTVGEVAHIELPEASQGRALVTVENGTGILEQRWLELAGGRIRFDVPVTAAMSPNAYVSVTLIQPHAGRGNDRPIRLYGVIPLPVTDPATRLTPVITAADEWRPSTEVSVDVAEAAGRPMTYTVAVVDEGLLGLTGFTAPDLHDHFYQKEALGVSTWDLFDDVVGAYGGALERLLALGGSEGAAVVAEPEESRFPPVVRFLGPFTLRARGKNTHQVSLPQYIGQVRVMVVAGQDGAYGTASKSVFVREPLSMLATLPRVIGPDEEMAVPVLLFATDPAIRRVTVAVQPGEQFTVVGSATTEVTFSGAGERLAFLRLKAGARPGRGRIRFTAAGAQHRTSTDVTLEVRSPNPVVTRYARQELAPGATWRTDVTPFGLPGTGGAALEVTTLPPLNLEQRLQFLVRYPHGCLEQVTSAVFPQLYLPALMRLERGAREEVEKNVQAGIDRLRGFQVPTGGFVYWPGGFAGGTPWGEQNAWATNYAGHFLVEAGKAGYHVPPEMLLQWITFQRREAQSWTPGADRSALEQAYRLYTLALADRAELSAMNRLRQANGLGTPARWLLAAAYRLAGVADVAADLVRDGRRDVATYTAADATFGSPLRDRAIVLMTLVTLDRRGEAEAVAREISEELASDTWHSTHAVAFSLLAMTRYFGVTGDASRGFAFERQLGGGRAETVNAAGPIHTIALDPLPPGGQALEIRNTSGRNLYASVVTRGVPRPGEETAAAEGLTLQVDYTSAQGRPLDVGTLPQGTDLVAHVSVTNPTRLNLENVALTHLVPAGWEIHNPRLGADDAPGGARPAVDHQDVRDDRVYSYFPLQAGESRRFAVALNAAYLGRYYLPGVSVEAMYDAARHARTAGRWVTVVPRSP
jgi:uncharacterized protein YfaS (alpha-2-macroglobulin family)